MMKNKILIIAGARPNFMKIAPLMKEFKKKNKQFKIQLLHTGQHYDFKMSSIFFRDLEIPKPDIYLGVGSGSHAEQTAKVMVSFEKQIIKDKPDLVIVVGDVNSTLACSLVASKLGIKVAHVEAGLRSFDRNMPEEINRLVTDSLSDFLFVSEKSGLSNLVAEGVSNSKIFFVGNTMIDTLLYHLPKIESSKVCSKLNLNLKAYAVLTLHRPSNVDKREALLEILEILKQITKKYILVYPAHPRTKKMIESFSLSDKFLNLKNFIMIDPLGYVDFIKLVKDSAFVLTDSGGIQEETTVLKVPCLTMRENTERPATVEEGTNSLVGRDHKLILRFVNEIAQKEYKGGKIPKFWDGKTSGRIIEIIKRSI